MRNPFLCFVDGQIIPERYDKYIFSSDRCFQGINACNQKNLSYEILESGFKSPENLRTAENYIISIKPIIIRTLMKELNEYHITKYSFECWNVMLNAWLTRYLVSYYEKYLRLLKVYFTFDYSNMEWESNVVPLDYMDADSLLVSSDFLHGTQYSNLINGIERIKCLATEKSRNIAHYRTEVCVRKTRGYYKSKIYRIFDRISTFLCKPNYNVVFNNCYLPNEFVFELSKINQKIHAYFTDYGNNERRKLSRFEPDVKWREKQIDCKDATDEFQVFILKRIKKDIPIAYVEGFRYLQKSSRKIYSAAMQPRAIFYAGGAPSDELFKNYLMNMRMNSAIFCDIQHGGDYGIDHDEIRQYEFEISDVFYTWGWNNEDTYGCKFVPMPAAKLLNTKSIVKSNSSKILYVNYIYEKNVFKLSEFSVDYYDDIISEMDYFKKLDEEVLDRMRVRLFPSDYGWNVKQKIDSLMIGIKFDNEKDYYTSLLDSSLVVTNRICTTTLEALHLGCPVVFLVNKDVRYERAKELIEELKAVKVVAGSWEELVQITIKASTNTWEWWNDPNRKAVVEAFKNEYLYCPANSRDLWIEEITKYC